MGAVIVGVVSPVVSAYDGDGGIHGSAQSDFSGFVVVGVDLPMVVVVVMSRWDGDGGGDGDGGTHGSVHRDALDVSSRYGDDGGDGDGGTHGSAHRDTLDGVVFSFADATIITVPTGHVQSIPVGRAVCPTVTIATTIAVPPGHHRRHHPHYDGPHS